MNNSELGFFRGRLRSLRFAIRGMFVLVGTEHSIMVQLFLGGLVTLLGFILGIETWEWVAQIVAIGLVLATESMNTAVEKLCDFVQPEWDQRIGRVKDISAGAVTFAALTAIIVGLIIYVPRLLSIV